MPNHTETPSRSAMGKKVLDGMQQRFPALTHLDLTLPSDIETGQTAPIRSWADLHHVFWLECVPIPGLPCPPLTLSVSSFAVFHHSGYISPEAIVTCLSKLPRLETLNLEFESPPSRPNRETQRPPSPTRSVLPALIRLSFTGIETISFGAG
jgi:hypothetical protein